MSYTDQIPDLTLADLTKDWAKAHLIADQTISRGAWTALVFGATVWNTANYWSSGNPTKLTVPAAHGGLYFIRGNCIWEQVSEDCSTQGRIYKNGIAIPGSHSGQYVNRAAGGDTWLPTNNLVNFEMELASGDYIEFFVWCSLSLAASVNALGNANPLYASWMSIERIG
jgi:hypothetical protein